jgi:oligopeptidase B
MSRVTKLIGRTAIWLAVGVVLAIAVGCAEKAPIPPTAKIVPKVDTLFGDVRVDNYFWLRERDNPDVVAYLEAENQYTTAVMAHTEKLQQELYDEMLGRINETDLSVPVQDDSFFYYDRTEEGKQYQIYCRKKKSLEAPEEIILDVNRLAEGYEYFDLGNYTISPDHRMLAFSTDTDGSERYTLFVKDLVTGQLLSDTIPNTESPVQWANDNQTLFYTVLDSINRPYRLYRHRLGTDPGSDALIYEEPDEAFDIFVERTKSEKYLFMMMGSIDASETYYLRADDPTGTFTLIKPRQPEVMYYVYDQGDDFYIHTNEGATNFKLMKTPAADPSPRNWVEAIPHRDSVYLEGVDTYRDFMVIFERQNGLRRIRIDDLVGRTSHYVPFQEPIFIIWPMDNIEYNTDWLRFTYMSLVTPQTVYDYDMRTQTMVMKKQYEVLGGYDAKQYTSERIFATAPDGTPVPISLVYKKGIRKDGSNPLEIHGYGAYGSSMEPTFSSNRLSLIDRGFILALAHVRGGTEMGRQWYDQGKLLHKKNTFTDFIACAEYLIAQRYTSPDKLVISGASAGGLLVGAVTVMRPDLFKTVVADVPFVDVINTMLDPSIPLTVAEYTEWGNPAEKEYYEYMKGYSPYDNVGPGAYPNLLITAGLNDPRVQYWEPAKWTAKLRALKTDNNRLLLKTNMGAGHMGASGRYDYLKDVAFEYAFVLDVMGMAK